MHFHRGVPGCIHAFVAVVVVVVVVVDVVVVVIVVVVVVLTLTRIIKSVITERILWRVPLAHSDVVCFPFFCVLHY